MQFEDKWTVVVPSESTLDVTTSQALRQQLEELIQDAHRQAEDYRWEYQTKEGYKNP